LINNNLFFLGSKNNNNTFPPVRIKTCRKKVDVSCKPQVTSCSCGVVLTDRLKASCDLTSRELVQSVSSRYGVKAMPTFFLIKSKEVVGKIVGANPDEVKKLVDASAEPLETQIVVE
jgi:hypothetical protein